MRLTAAPILLLGALALPVLAEPVVYALDLTHSFVHFEIRHFDTATIRGRFGPVNGSVTLDRAAGRGNIDLAINTASVSTGLRVFDSRLREADLLATSDHPQALFISDQFRFEGEQLKEVRGQFTLRGVSQPLSLRALRFACEPRAVLAQREVCGGNFEATIERSAFGISFGTPFVADRVRIVIQVEGVRQ